MQLVCRICGAPCDAGALPDVVCAACRHAAPSFVGRVRAVSAKRHAAGSASGGSTSPERIESAKSDTVCA